MSVKRRIITRDVNGVTVIGFVDRKILEAANIQELGEELTSLVETEGHHQLLLDFTNVEFLSSAALNKLIILDRKVKGVGGRLKLCCLKPEIHEVFVITRLNQLFSIHDTEELALAAF
jgi:anti-sigma B factor antagonist